MLDDLMLLPEWQEVCQRYRYDITRFAVEALDMTIQAGQAVTWQQELLFKSIVVPGSRTSVASGHGCFGIDTPIMLSSGKVKKVQNIQVGDKLMGDDGRSVREVLDIVSGMQELFEFRRSNGTKITYNASHILCLFDIRTKQTLNLTVYDYILSPDKYFLHEYVLGKSENSLLNFQISDTDYHIAYIEEVAFLGEGNYYGFVLDGNSQFLGGDFTVLHNTGKSRSAGIIALWHLLFYPESVMLFTAPQIGQLRTVVWKEINICLQRLRNNKALGWLADYVVVLAEKIYIKGFKDTWFVFAKTAPKHQPTNIAGQHGDHYMVWADEACGIDDAVMEVAIGALTHENNRAVLTSQPAKNTGFFYDTHHKLSHHNGGKWTALEFNGEMSPIVSKDKLIEALYQYGSRNSPGYLIRIRGKFPELKGEYLLTRTDYENMKQQPCVIEEGDKWGIIVTVDVGGDVGRDSSVISVMQVVDKMIKGRIERHVHLLDIPLFSNRANINTLKAKINDVMSDYPGATLVIDPLGAGMGLTQSLKADGVYFDEVHWGSPCFNNTLKRYYMNKRSHAYVSMAKAVEKGYFSVSDKVKKMYQVITNLEEQMTRLPYYFDEKARWCMMSKKDMLKKGIKSPDIADTIAFGFMENISYAPVESYEDLSLGSTESDELDLLKQAADELLGD